MKIDKVRMVMITDSNTTLTAFKAGKVDLLDRIPPQMTPQLIESGEAKMAPRNLDDQLRVLGPNHPDTLASRNNLALAYESAGRLDEAIDLYEQN